MKKDHRWNPVYVPAPENIILDTKIEDMHGLRNEQQLVREGNLWWTTNRKMYVYYSPTHWRLPL